MATCYILIGPMGCGKSTWRNAMLETMNDPVVVSTDDCFEELARADGITYAEAWNRYSYDDMVKKERVKIIRATIAGRDIVIDQTNCTAVSRQLFRYLLPPSYRTVGVVFEFEPEEILRRVFERGNATGKRIPRVVVEEKMKSFEPPMKNEFDEVIVVPLV